MNISTEDFESLTQTVQALQTQLAEANQKIESHQNDLHMAAQRVQTVEQQLIHAQQELAQTRTLANSDELPGTKPRINKPQSFNGKGSITSWTIQMDNYVRGTDDQTSLSIALSYLSGNAHEWWIVFQKTEEGQSIHGWGDLRGALVQRFETLNKEKIARDKLARWKQIKDVATFNEDFLKIILDIPNINVEEQIDRYTRGLKPHIWRELCTKDYKVLADAMRDAERVESAHRRSGISKKSGSHEKSSSFKQGNGSTPTPMEIGNIQLQKLTKEERDKCMREGLCLRCREKGHMAKNCPKGRRN